MGTAFAASQARLGRAAVQRLANASAVLPLGGTVEGILRRERVVSSVGAAGMQARDVTFVCLSDEIDDATARGAQIDVSPSGGDPVRWRIAQVDVEHELGQAVIALERP